MTARELWCTNQEFLGNRLIFVHYKIFLSSIVVFKFEYLAFTFATKSVSSACVRCKIIKHECIHMHKKCVVTNKSIPLFEKKTAEMAYITTLPRLSVHLPALVIMKVRIRGWIPCSSSGFQMNKVNEIIRLVD